MSNKSLTLEQLQNALAPLNEQVAANSVANEEIKQLLLNISAKLDVSLATEETVSKKPAKKAEAKKRAPRKKKADSDDETEEVPEKKRTTRKKKVDSDNEEVPEKKRATSKKAVKTAPEEFKPVNKLQFFNKEFKEKGTNAFPQLTEDVIDKLKSDNNFEDIPEEKQQERLRSLCYKYMSEEHGSVLMNLKAAYNDRGNANKVVIEEKDAD